MVNHKLTIFWGCTLSKIIPSLATCRILVQMNYFLLHHVPISRLTFQGPTVGSYKMFKTPWSSVRMQRFLALSRSTWDQQFGEPGLSSAPKLADSYSQPQHVNSRKVGQPERSRAKEFSKGKSFNPKTFWNWGSLHECFTFTYKDHAV